MEFDDQSSCLSLPWNVHMITTPFLYKGEGFILSDVDADAQKEFNIAI